MSTTPSAPSKTPAAAAPEWLKWATGWHVYPLRFMGAPIHEKDWGAAPVNRIRKLINWPPYVQELGLNVLQLMPVFESTNHGYDVRNYYHIDSRPGTEEGMKAVIEAAHERGTKVFFDGVLSRTGSEAPALKTARESPDSEEAQFFAFTHSVGNMTAPVFEGYESLVESDRTSDTTVDFVVNVTNHWLTRGTDGWRLGAAYAVDPQFWHKALPWVCAEHPHAFICGEVIHGDYAEIVLVSGMDSVMEHKLWRTTWSVPKEENLFGSNWTLKHHNTFTESFMPVTFVGDHNVLRITTQVGIDKTALATTVLLTVAGMPLVYHGDEQGYTGLKKERIGGDDQIRPVFPDCPERLSTFGADLYHAYQQLVAVRRHFPWLHFARVGADELRDGFLRYRVTTTDAAFVNDATEASGEVGASGEIPSLVVELNLENGAASAVTCDDNYAEFEFP